MVQARLQSAHTSTANRVGNGNWRNVCAMRERAGLLTDTEFMVQATGVNSYFVLVLMLVLASSSPSEIEDEEEEDSEFI